MQLTITTPKNFNFKRTVLSHGWYDLPPFALDTNSWTLTRVIDLDGARPVTATVTGTGKEIQIDVPRKLNKKAAEKVLRDIRHSLRLDDDLSSFYAAVA